MRILSLRNLASLYPSLHIEDTNRKLFTLKFENIQLTGRNIHYPNCLLKVDTSLINPYDERVLSLQKDSFYDNNEWNGTTNIPTIKVEYPVFFFLYNVDNYFHFVYDTLPILYSYFQLKEKYPTLKLLLQTSHPTKSTFSPFVLEFLRCLKIESYDLANRDTVYSTMFISTSHTHGGKSNDAPSSVSHTVWNALQTNFTGSQPKKFYISRRSWIHGKTENIGTNYTTRRKCMNEDLVVKVLQSYGIQEIFTELLTTEEKIALFQQAELVIGIIGGGMCNLLFSPPKTKSLCIATPHFLTINERFKYSMDHTKILYSNSASLSPYQGLFPLYSRVKVKITGRIGEIEEYKENLYRVSLSQNDVAGFSQDFPIESLWISENELESIDSGLNSPFQIDIQKLEADLNKLFHTQ
jgi:hypothetical protein